MSSIDRMYLPYIPLILFLFQQLRNEYDGISPDPGGTNRGFPGTSGPPRSEESCGNLQHISGNLKKSNYYTNFNLEMIQIRGTIQPGLRLVPSRNSFLALNRSPHFFLKKIRI